MTRTLLKFVVILALICLLMGGGVAVLYGVWRDQIAERERAATRAAMLAVAPEGAEVDVEKPLAGGTGGPSAVYAARDPSGKTIGYVAGGGARDTPASSGSSSAPKPPTLRSWASWSFPTPRHPAWAPMSPNT